MYVQHLNALKYIELTSVEQEIRERVQKKYVTPKEQHKIVQQKISQEVEREERMQVEQIKHYK